MLGIAAGNPVEGIGFWAQVYGQSANQDIRDSVPGYDSRTFGGAVGADTKKLLDNTVLGLALNYAATAVDGNDANTTETDIGSYGVTFYGSYDMTAQTFVTGQLGYPSPTKEDMEDNWKIAVVTGDVLFFMHVLANT